MTISPAFGSGQPVVQFSGLNSGLDTAGIISSLMKIESAPQAALMDAVAFQQKQVNGLQSINSSLMALATSAGSFVSGSTWTQLVATSSNPAITVTAASSATPATTNVVVASVASAAHGFASSASAGVTYTLNDAQGNPLTYTDKNGNTQTATYSSDTGSLSDIAAQINKTAVNTGVRAVVINATDGDGNPAPVLEIVSTKTGVGSNFSITGDDGSTLTSATNGANAQLTVDGQSITSQSNTVTIADGVTITLGANAAASGSNTSTIAVTDDGSSRSTALNGFVQQLNDVLHTLSSATAYGAVGSTPGAGTTGAGLFAGSADLRNVATNLVNTIFAPGNTVSLANMGLSVDRYGAITFDQDMFQAAYQADPSAVQDAFVGPNGFATRVQQAAFGAAAPAGTSYTDSATGQLKFTTYEGSLITSINSLNSQINDGNSRIDNWTRVLSMRQQTLQNQYTALEKMLSGMQAQADYVTSALNSLSTPSSSKS